MKTLILTLIVVALFSVNSFSQIPNESTVTEINLVEDPKGSLTLVYESYNYQLEVLEAKRDIKLWDNATFDKKKALIPKGGTLKFTLMEKKEEYANPGNLKLVIRSADGTTLHSGMISKKTPEKKNGFWTQIKWVKLKEVVLPELVTVVTAHSVSKRNYKWEIQVK